MSSSKRLKLLIRCSNITSRVLGQLPPRKSASPNPNSNPNPKPNPNPNHSGVIVRIPIPRKKGREFYQSFSSLLHFGLKVTHLLREFFKINIPQTSLLYCYFYQGFIGNHMKKALKAFRQPGQKFLAKNLTPTFYSNCYLHCIIPY